MEEEDATEASVYCPAQETRPRKATIMTSKDTAASLMRLERKVGRLSVLCGLLGVTLLLSVVMPTYEVRAQRFVLLDDDGQQRGMWRVRSQDAALILQDTTGVWRAVVNVNDDDAELWLSHPGREQEPTRVTLSSDGPRVVVVDETGETVVPLP